MVTLIPLVNNKISKHFTRADTLAFFNDGGEELARVDNPVAHSEGCLSRQNLMQLITSFHTNNVVLCHVGEKMLNKLLEMNLKVFRTEDTTIDAHVLLNRVDELIPMLSSMDAHPSPRAEKKKKNGESCGCDADKKQHGCGNHGHDSKKGCCGGHSHH